MTGLAPADRRPLCLIAAGGTGGHMFPAQALSEVLLTEGWRVKLSTDERGARYAGAFPDEVTREVVQSATFARGGKLAKLGVPARIGLGIGRAFRALRADPPAVVIGFGGYPTIPALSAAVMLGIPRMIHEQNGVMGRVNRLFSRRVNRIACGTWPTDLPANLPASVKVVHTGNPVRAAVLARAGEPYAAPYASPPADAPAVAQAPTDPAPESAGPSLLVIGGSQGARVLSDVVPAALASLPEAQRTRLHVSHQARAEDETRVRDAYAEAGITADVRPFFDDVPDRMARAQLVISRAGASSIADITAIGRPAILIPYAAAAGDHQSANARAMALAGAAVVMPESGLTPDGLASEVRGVLSNPARASQMAGAAASLGRPDAARSLAAIVTELSPTLHGKTRNERSDQTAR